MEKILVKGDVYSVATKTECVVTSAGGAELGTATAGNPCTFIATTDRVELSDPDAEFARVNPKYASVKLRLFGLLGGGVSSALPSGYLAAAFLESTGKEYIDTDIPWKSSDVLRLDYEAISDTSNYNIFGVNNNYRFLNTSVVQMVIKGSAYNFATVLTKGKHYILFDTTYRYVFDGEEKEGYHASWTAGNLTLFSISSHTYNAVIRFYKFTHENEAKVVLVPAVSPNGEPCLVDTESKKAYTNNGSGAFVVGLTLAQARKLSKLPAGGGALTVSLPSNWPEDDGVVNALAEAESKGWVFTCRTYDADVSVSTFGMRRIWVRKTQNDNGEYVSADGSRWYVEWCVGMIGAEPEAHGYEPYRSVEAAVAYWELEPVVYPEEDLTEK